MVVSEIFQNIKRKNRYVYILWLRTLYKCCALLKEEALEENLGNTDPLLRVLAIFIRLTTSPI